MVLLRGGIRIHREATCFQLYSSYIPGLEIKMPDFVVDNVDRYKNRVGCVRVSTQEAMSEIGIPKTDQDEHAAAGDNTCVKTSLL